MSSSTAGITQADPVQTTSTVAFTAASSDDEAAVEMDRGNVEERMGLVDPNKVAVLYLCVLLQVLLLS